MTTNQLIFVVAIVASGYIGYALGVSRGVFITTTVYAYHRMFRTKAEWYAEVYANLDLEPISEWAASQYEQNPNINRGWHDDD